MTTLSQQLVRLAARDGREPCDERTGASLLFDASDAKRYGIDEFFALGTNGFSTLLSLEPSLAEFAEPLFSESAANIQRGLLGRVEAEQLNRIIDQFLYRLMPFLQLAAAHKAVEWLIQRFNVGRENAEALLGTFLPYHGTNLFRRLLQHVAPALKHWQWLTEIAKQNVPITREVLVSYCLRERTGIATLHKVVDRAFEVVPAEQHESLRLLCTLQANVLLAVLFVERVQPAWLVSDVLAHAVEGIRHSYTPLVESSLAILAALATKVPLEPRATAPLVVELLRLALRRDHLRAQGLLTAAVLCEFGDGVVLTKKCMKRLLRSPEFPACADILKDVAQDHDLGKLAEALAAGLPLVESRKDSLLHYADCEALLRCLDTRRNVDIVVQMDTAG